MTYSIDFSGTTNTVSTCANCLKRLGTQKWVGDGGAAAFVHGWYVMWCEVCVLEAQLVYAKERAAAIPLLEAELVAAKAR